ncbi:hypothetical protein PV325_009986, partial [Microctonus aethiopoides]
VVHFGVDNTDLNNILACANLAQIGDRLYKNYQDIIVKANESEARESCRGAASGEKKLVIENVKKLCDILPPEITQDIFPQLDVFNIPSENNNSLFDTALGCNVLPSDCRMTYTLGDNAT